MKNEYPRNIRVYVQLHTKKDFNMDYVKILSDRQTLCVRSTKDFYDPKSDDPHYWIFETNGVFCNDRPDLIYKTISENFLPTVSQGTNITFIGFGQTGTGKSTTMHGLNSVFKNRGLSVRILEDLMNYKEVLKSDEIEIEASCVEVHKDHLIDLLTDDYNKIYSPYKKVKRLPIKSIEEGFTYLFFSEIKRSSFQTDSYISHGAPSIFTIYIKNTSSYPNEKFSKINIIDFSGTDTMGNATCFYRTKREVGESNLFKSQLEQLLMYFNKNQVKDDKILREWGSMVQYLSDSLKPQNNLRFIAHVFTTKDNLPITLSHLRLIQLALTTTSAKIISCSKRSKYNKDHNLKTMLEYFMEQEDLRSMVLNEDGSHNRKGYKNKEMEFEVNNFLYSKTKKKISFFNVSDAQTALNIMKDMFCEREAKLQSYLQQDKKSAYSKSEVFDHRSSIRKSQQAQQASDLRARRSTKMSQVEKDILKEKRKSRGTTSSRRSSRKSGKRVRTPKKSVTTSSSTLPERHSSVKSVKSHASKHRIKKPKSAASITKTKKVISKTISEDESISDLKLDFNDYDDIWKMFTKKEIFTENYRNLQKVAGEYLVDLQHYNDILTKIDLLTQMLEQQQNYYRKARMFRRKDKSKENQEKLDEIQNNLEIQVKKITESIIDSREELLAKQAELKINLDDYHRIKKDIGECFIKYCRETYNIYLGNGEQYIDDEQLLSPENSELNMKISTTLGDNRNQRKEVIFYYFQTEMNKIISQNMI